jgi:hypothetical protein
MGSAKRMARNRRYEHSGKGKARKRRYAQTEKGKARLNAASRRYKLKQRFPGIPLDVLLNLPEVCAACHRKVNGKKRHIHHVTYDPPFPVTVLCAQCHGKLTRVTMNTPDFRARRDEYLNSQHLREISRSS